MLSPQDSHAGGLRTQMHRQYNFDSESSQIYLDSPVPQIHIFCKSESGRPLSCVVPLDLVSHVEGKLQGSKVEGRVT